MNLKTSVLLHAMKKMDDRFWPRRGKVASSAQKCLQLNHFLNVMLSQRALASTND